MCLAHASAIVIAEGRISLLPVRIVFLVQKESLNSIRAPTDNGKVPFEVRVLVIWGDDKLKRMECTGVDREGHIAG